MAEMDIKTFVNVATRLPPSTSVLIRGPHGIGKSELVSDISKNIELQNGDIGLDVIDRRLAQMTEGDMIGLPELVDGVTRFAPNDWLLRACREPVALFLDELNRATQEVQQCAFQLVLDRELNGNVLHPETRIFCAINDSAEYQVNEMDPALLDRFWVVDLEPTKEDWVEWARSNGVDEVIVDFINDNGAHLRHTAQIEPGKVYPTPRSYAKLDASLRYIGWEPLLLAGSDTPDGFYALCNGYIGLEAALAFKDFVTNYDLQISASDVLDSWKKNKNKVLKLTTPKQQGVIEKLIEHCKENEWTASQASNACKFVEQLSGEILVDFFNSVMETNNVPNIRSVHSKIGMKVVEAVTAAEKV
jgi:hypothetical protein